MVGSCFEAEEHRLLMESTPLPWNVIRDTDGPGEGSPTALDAQEVRAGNQSFYFRLLKIATLLWFAKCLM
jgi:hypothetical protein